MTNMDDAQNYAQTAINLLTTRQVVGTTDPQVMVGTAQAWATLALAAAVLAVEESRP